MDESRVALVTGAGRGIGRHLAVGLADQGLAVGLVGRHADTLEDTAEECRARGTVAELVTADVTDGVAVTAAVDRLTERLGPVDLLVNNAGRIDATESRFVECDLDDVLGVLEVNLVGALRVLRAVLPGMVARRRGRVLDVNSGFAYHRSVGYLGYAVSKAALARVTDLLALDLAADGVVTLDVSPGLVRTALSEAFYQAPGVLEARNKAVPLGRIAKTSDIADAVVFFASDRASYVTGQEIVVDGGFAQTLMSHVPRPGF